LSLFSDIHISQGSVGTHLRRGEIFNNDNLIVNLSKHKF